MIGLRVIFLKHKLMRTFCRLTREEDRSSVSNNRSMNHFASSRITWKFLRTVLLTNVQRDVASRRGWLVRFVEKETQKRGDVGDRRRTRGNTRRIRFFLGSVRFLHTTKRTSSVPIRFDPWLEVFSGRVSVSNACFIATLPRRRFVLWWERRAGRTKEEQKRGPREIFESQRFEASVLLLVEIYVLLS